MPSLSFPSNPSNGDTYAFDGLTYQYNASKNKWEVVSTTTIEGISADAINQNLVPSANVTYDLGTANNSFRDLYLSGSSINLGGQTITANESGIILPEGSTVGGVTIGTGSGGAVQYANTASLPTTGLTAGEFAFVGNTLFMTNGQGWYSVALINQTPELTLSTSSISLGADGGNTINFTFTATDPDGPEPTVTASTTANTSQANVTVHTANSTVTVENLSAEEYSANITVTASDGINQTFGTVTLNVVYVSDLWDETVLSIGTSNASDNQTFVDRSINAHTVTPTGTPSQTAFHPYLDNWSVEFGGAENIYFTPSLSTPIDSNTDFCFETWIYPTNLEDGQNGIFQAGQLDESFAVRHNTSGTIQVISNNDEAQTVSSNALIENRWQHIAVTRDSGTLRIFIDGVESASENNSMNYRDLSNTNFFVVGSRYYSGSGQLYFHGNLSNIRFIVGNSIYTANFTPPTEDLTAVSGTLLLTCQSNRFIDNSTNAHAITVNGDPKISAFNPFGQESEYAVGENKGSGYFDGSGENLAITDADDFDFGTGDFTVECWFYETDLSDTFVVLASSTGVNQYFAYGALATGGMTMYLNGDAIYSGSSNTPIGNQWNHLVWQRASGVASMYLNGVRVYNASYTVDAEDASGFRVGRSEDYSAYYAEGYIADFRVSKGTAIYSGESFTPPTSPVGNTNASLYLPMDNAGIFDKTGLNTLTPVGNASTSTTQVKYSNTSMYFDGTGDYIVTKNYESLILGTSDFTIETWIYANALPSAGVYWVFIDNRAQSSAGDTNRITIAFKGNTIVFYSKAADRITSGAVSINQWYHLVLCRSGSTTKMFINGSQVGSDYTDTTNYNNTADRPIIGGDGDGVLSAFNGYLENFQILKGVAKYTTNFTPPNQTQGRIYQAES